MASLRDDRRRLACQAKKRGQARHAVDDAVDRAGLRDEDARVGHREPRHEPYGVQRRRHDEIGSERGDPLEVDVLEPADPREGAQLCRKLRVFLDSDQALVGADRQQRIGATRRERDDTRCGWLERNRARKIVGDESFGSHGPAV